MKRESSIDPTLPSAAISEQIAKSYPTLTSSHQKAAEFVLANPFRAATMSIEEFATAAGVSPATANRFARALNFDGYPQFRTALVNAFETTLAPVESLRAGLKLEASSLDIFARSLREDIENLERTLKQLDAHACEKAVDMILCAPRIFVMGFSTSAYLGAVLAHRLEPCCPMVQTVASEGGPSQAARRLFKLKSDDLVIAISFPRYNKITVEMLKLARAQKAKVLALTDRATAPIVPLSDVALYAKSDHSLSANSEAAALALIESMCGAVVYKSRNALQNATALTEFLVPYFYTGFQHAKADSRSSAQKKRVSK